MAGKQTLLPSDPVKAVKHITGIVQQLLGIMERESRAMATQDAVSFTASQEEKSVLVKSYEQCSAEFRARIADFRNVDRALLDRLDSLQRELSAKGKENMAAMERMSG